MKNIEKLVIAGALFGMLSTVACGGAGGLGGALGAAAPKEDTGKSVVEEAQGVIAELKGEYVVTFGIVDEVMAKIDNLAQVSPEVNLKQLKLKEFTSALQQCWDSEVTEIENTKLAALDLKDAAQDFNRKEGLRDLKQSKTAVKNAVDNAEKCVPAALDDAKKLPKNATDATKAFVDQKIGEVDAIRVLVKKEIPARAESLLKTAVGSVGKLAALGARLQAELQNPLADNAAIKGHIEELNKLTAELQGMANKVQTDAKSLSSEVTAMPAKIQKAYSSFGN